MVAGNQRNLFLFSEAANHEADDMEISFYIYNQNSEAVAIEIGLQTDLMNAGSYSSVSEVVAEPGVWCGGCYHRKHSSPDSQRGNGGNLV